MKIVGLALSGIAALAAIGLPANDAVAVLAQQRATVLPASGADSGALLLLATALFGAALVLGRRRR